MSSMRIKSVRFKNFKRFEKYHVSLSGANILVGPNNAGKSTILDAFRILYGARRYAVRLRPQIIQTDEGDQYGYEIPESSIPVNILNVIRDLYDDSAEVEFTHENGTKLKMIFYQNRQPRLYISDSGTSHYTGKTYFQKFPIDLVIVPTLSPFESMEPYISDEVVERERSTRLSSRHFRNIWYRQKVEFSEFKSLVEGTWNGIAIEAPTRPQLINSYMEMFFYEGRQHPREVAWSGFGLQVWMQILTHLMRGTRGSIFILDEPDVYLHPDMQRKLLSLVSSRFNQYLLATHSTEIINEAEPGDIIAVDSERQSGRRIKSDEEYNHLYAYIGSIENIDLAKLARAKKVVFFEGKDKKILTKFCRRAGINQPFSSGDTAIISVGGFGQWTKVIDTAWTFKNVLKFDVKIFALFDRDYRDQREIDKTVVDIEAHGVQCAIWRRKELENYALNSESLGRCIIERCEQRGYIVSAEKAISIMLEVSEQYKHDVIGNIASESFKYEQRIKSGKDFSDSVREASILIEAAWKSLDQRFNIIPGKQFLSDLSAKLQADYQTTLTTNMVIDTLRKEELDLELTTLLTRLATFCNG
ncbi:hypothetical protein C5L14_19580 [Labrys okinawensis]|uniref:Uncharacterized protein n=1 Tax=Labrys okinawensis TaxID=346911 RepID=A0A2S9Q8S8_9HYPH|nr:ATP-binding protein [Labrys okinawensis]PRH85762.1 hypothetical protein C5L14_19580 [Labrys okinawensis]